MIPVQIGDRKLLEIADWMYSATSMNALFDSITRGVAQLIPSDCYDLVLCQTLLNGGEFFLCAPGTYTPCEVSFLLEHAMEHPIARAYAGGAKGALKLSQCGSLQHWRKSPLFHEGGYRRLGLMHELTVEIPGIRQSCLAAFSIVRGGKDYSTRDGEILNLLRPHMARAWMMVQRRNQSLSPELLRQAYPQLSQRETEILFWIVEGKQNAEIATILERRLGTIQEHVESILKKLDMENRHQMTVNVLKDWHGTRDFGL